MLSKGILALVLVGGLPDEFRIGSEWNNYMYKSIYEAVVSCKLREKSILLI